MELEMMKVHSNLVSGVYIAHSGNYQKGRSGYKICKITPHQMAGKLTGKQCAVNIFGKAGRKASANYCIGYDGDIVCNVEEENRAYTSSSKWNDCQAITIEVSNSANGTDKITEASWNSLVNLCEDICRRYNFRLVYDGTKNGSLTRHNMYANTNCPGSYLQPRLPELARIVNERLDGNKYKQGQNVEIHVPIAQTGAVQGQNVQVESDTIQNPATGSKQFWINKTVIKDGQIIARATICAVQDRIMVQVFDQQFWIQSKDIVKVL